MARSSLSLDSAWRDYYAMWNPRIEPLMAPLEESKCHAPRLALIPDQEHQTVPAGGTIDYSFRLVPGSVLVGFWVVTGFSIQLRDVELEHSFFQEPSSTDLLITAGADQGRFPSMTLWPAPHPVVGDALFALKVWGQPGSLFQMILAAAEVTDCPVR